MNAWRKLDTATKLALTALLLAAVAVLVAALLALWLDDARDTHNNQIRNLQQQIKEP